MTTAQVLNDRNNRIRLFQSFDDERKRLHELLSQLLDVVLEHRPQGRVELEEPVVEQPGGDLGDRLYEFKAVLDQGNTKCTLRWCIRTGFDRVNAFFKSSLRRQGPIQVSRDTDFLETWMDSRLRGHERSD